MNLVKKNKSFLIESESMGNSKSVRCHLSHLIAIVFTQIEGVIRGKTASSLSGEKSVANPMDVGDLRDFEIEKAVLHLRGTPCKMVHTLFTLTPFLCRRRR